MTPAQAAMLRRVQVDAQTRFDDFDMLISFMNWNDGYVQKDLHGCLSLTPAGLAALADHDAGVAKS